MKRLAFWHRHRWCEWDRAWGAGPAKAFVLERRCEICGKVETKVIR